MKLNYMEPPLPNRSVYIERMSGASPPLPQALLAVAQAVQAHRNVGPFQYAGNPPRRIRLTESGLGDWLADVQSQRAKGISALFTLSDDPALSTGHTIAYEIDALPDVAVEYLWLPLAENEALVCEPMMDLVVAMSQGFGAHRGVIEDHRLLLGYRGTRAAERARSVLPEHLKPYVPEPPVTDIAGSLPHLLVPQEFDRRRVPDSVWWINFWDAMQVETVGRDLVLQAGWERIVEAKDGALALAVTQAPTDSTRPDHVARLTQFIEHLRLRDLQQIHHLR